jgi:hypothetical protein
MISELAGVGLAGPGWTNVVETRSDCLFVGALIVLMGMEAFTAIGVNSVPPRLNGWIIAYSGAHIEAGRAFVSFLEL